MLRVENLSIFYDRLQVLFDLCLEVPDAALVVLIGSNGAGKSTLLNTIMGLLRPSTGRIFYADKDLTDYPTYLRVKEGISLVPEGRRIFPYMTVIENLASGAYPKKARRIMNDSLERVYNLFPILKERRKQLASTLSGGEQQMLAIARALMSKPSMLMLDEPSLGLMPTMIASVFDTIKTINKEGVSILLVEQNVYRALEIADKAYVLENGRIALEGTGDDLLENPHVKKAYISI